MQSFNCLSMNCPIFGPHLLEASAGTGKTFSIEHVVVRLLLESEEIEIEQILAVTFTRAATRDLKKRIRANIEEALARIQSGKKSWEYLDPHLGSEKAVRKLSDASLAFDRCQIFTIHGFCHRMLQEFAFEAELGFSLRDPDREALIPKRLYREARKFLETGINDNLLVPEQMSILLKQYDSLSDFAYSLLKEKSEESSSSFAKLLERYVSLTTQRQIKEASLIEWFYRIESDYKTEIKGDFETQIKALAKSKESPSASLRSLIKEKGSLFHFLDPSNRKIKAKQECPEIFRWACELIGPLIREAVHPKKIFACLQAAWKQIEEPILSEEQWFAPDEILKKMRSAVSKDRFASAVRKKYKAVIVDEFQDTDPLQWDIFKILFLDASKPLSALYLVGDPKQSIYRFRNADIYTYFNARHTLGSAALFCLDTNYRSSSKMIDALNVLFNREWLNLPKLRQTMSCPPVKSRAEISSNLSDEKGAIHFIAGRSFEESWLPYAVSEIERLRPLFDSFSSFAVLVKDRYQAETALRMCKERAIPAIAKSHIPLGRTLAFQSVYEFFEALIFPKDSSRRRIVSAGPFASLALSDIRFMFDTQGFIPLCRNLLSCSHHSLDFQRDLQQVVEELLAWEGRFGFSSEGLLRFLEDFEQLDPDEGGRRRTETDSKAVQILTLHISKGLEFDVVFALGLGARQPEAEDAEEAEAEKLRQLYVAMTRAKKRLYVPIPTTEKSRGSLSPIELFSKTIESQERSFLSFLENVENVTYETLPEIVSLPPRILPEPLEERPRNSVFIPTVHPCILHSFTSLAQPKMKEFIKTNEPSQLINAHTIPRGIETGIVIHKIFEKLFSPVHVLWKDFKSVQLLISQQLKHTSLLPWESAITEMIWNTLNMSLPLERPFSLIQLEPAHLQVEMEFLFSQPPHFVKGYIDLVFCQEEKFYFVDWKTNWLGEDDAAYLSLNEAMKEHDYWLQARLYAEALQRHVKRFYNQPFEDIFGGAIYLFLRGGGICYFKPDLSHG